MINILGKISSPATTPAKSQGTSQNSLLAKAATKQTVASTSAKAPADCGGGGVSSKNAIAARIALSFSFAFFSLIPFGLILLPQNRSL
ncbi:hypothetical protein BKN38_00185 [Helicobacter sp. CLO-3]|uniref:hypothetical protein n=1 Tax=Helicobacter sp. CLO-3 TaxID=211 RepID=UPI0008D9A68C|nr:hypothetical protein [Helicobacter sp. CLO-3]OHU85860.1 hypothetical protein BKN38_00185 [Helicobacter sp. CLO-3]